MVQQHSFCSIAYTQQFIPLISGCRSLAISTHKIPNTYKHILCAHSSFFVVVVVLSILLFNIEIHCNRFYLVHSHSMLCFLFRQPVQPHHINTNRFFHFCSCFSSSAWFCFFNSSFISLFHHLFFITSHMNREPPFCIMYILRIPFYLSFSMVIIFVVIEAYISLSLLYVHFSLCYVCLSQLAHTHKPIPLV